MEGRDGIHDGIWDRIHDRTHGSSPHLGNVHGEPAPGGPDEPLDAFGPAQQQLGPLQVIAALGPERGLRQLPPPQLQELQLLLGWERGARPAWGSGCPHPPRRPRPQSLLYLFQWVWEPVGNSVGAVAVWEGARGEHWAGPGAMG